MKKSIFILLAFCFTFCNLYNFEIRGYVLDEEQNGAIGATVRVEGTTRGTFVKDPRGYFEIKNIPDKLDSILVRVTMTGCKPIEKTISNFDTTHYFNLEMDSALLQEIIVCSDAVMVDHTQIGSVSSRSATMGISIKGSRSVRSNISKTKKSNQAGVVSGGFSAEYGYSSNNKISNNHNFDYINESYKNIEFNKFLTTIGNPLSSFAADVDRASYSNIRRLIENGQKVDRDAVKIEEMINYFTYDYDEPKTDKFNIITEYSDCPWNPNHNLLMISLKSKDIPKDKLPQSHLVFLLDVSGSMNNYNKLPLVQSSLRMLIDNLDEDDRISIVTYAGNERIVCENIPCSKKQLLLNQINNLHANGSTNASSGIVTAYEISEKYFIEDGNNRIILATDGDFNVGLVDDDDLEKLIEEKREKNIYLSCLGFGMGNYKDDKIETLSHHGNGNYAYIDNLMEAKKQLISEMGGTLFTIAKDVKLQLEFNPYYVNSYRLIGYENRLMTPEEFQDIKKDAGEIGAGHSLTVLYEIVPSDVEEIETVKTKYIESAVKNDAKNNKELATLRIKYKDPKSEENYDIEEVINTKHKSYKRTSDNFRFAANVTIFGMFLRKSEFLPHLDYSDYLKSIEKSIGKDEEGYRKEFKNIVDLYLTNE